MRSSANDLLVIDAGTGVGTLGRELVERGELEIHFLMTHFHWDHIQGSPFHVRRTVNEARQNLENTDAAKEGWTIEL